ncbi:C13 family peptidase [Methyloversatilis thermotolerans]|uniref:C13 family peptidase n=1 Tax=Methyloversatilis thermotolerans TaxID=1346290 RepID=UPI00036BE04D|nr:C13 family peptidase [Methyloversatilis thermotolerans]
MELESSVRPDLPAPGAARSLRANLIAGLRFLALRDGWTPLQAGVGAWLLLLALMQASALVFDILRVDGPGRFAADALPQRLAPVMWSMLAVWVVVRVLGRPGAWLAGVTGVAAIGLWINLVWGGLSFAPDAFWSALSDLLGEAGDWLWWLPALWALCAVTIALARLCRASPGQRLFVFAVVGLVDLLPSLTLGDHEPLWVAVERDEGEDADDRWAAARSEAVMYRQPVLLAEAIARVEPGQAGKPELFLLAVAGHAAQDVFLREVDKVERLFAERFGTAGHSIVLANNPATVLDRPLATASAIEASLNALGARMNRDEDVLFVFLTSHGAEDYRFDLSMWPWELEQLTPYRLAGMLDAAGIRHRVILVSACYSGGFIGPLSGPDSLVMTAARADRSSHGCSHEADWTFFGRAFFDEALRATTSFTEAFARASAAVREREKAEGLTPSEPQIAVGEAIKPHLDGLDHVLRQSPPVHAAGDCGRSTAC